MRLLLDTHALLWWFLDDARLSARVRTALSDSSNELLVSSVSAFEITTKHRLGKLWTGKLEPADLLDIIEGQSMQELPLTMEHAVIAGGLPEVHRDPFDRLLIGQSVAESLPLVTQDAVFEGYHVDVFW
jgi:PIN domain nuclease of toxin-antitoxin system